MCVELLEIDVNVVLAVVILAVLLLYPLWIIFKRAGLDPRFALIVLIPYIGVLIVAILLGGMRWRTGIHGPGNQDNKGAGL